MLKLWSSSLIVAVSLILAACATRPEVKKVAHEAASKSEDAYAYEKKGEYQAFAEVKLNNWTSRIGELRSKGRTPVAVKTTKGSAVVAQAPSSTRYEPVLSDLGARIEDARSTLNDLRLAGMGNFEPVKTKLEGQMREIEGAFEKTTALME